jgi:hypothetical protein
VVWGCWSVLSRCTHCIIDAPVCQRDAGLNATPIHRSKRIGIARRKCVAGQCPSFVCHIILGARLIARGMAAGGRSQGRAQRTPGHALGVSLSDLGAKSLSSFAYGATPSTHVLATKYLSASSSEPSALDVAEDRGVPGLAELVDVEDLASLALAQPGARAPRDDWVEQYSQVRLMRMTRDAPVDTMGCDVLHDPRAPGFVQRFQVLVALMLSSQTKDEVTYAAMLRLRAHGCTPERLSNTAEVRARIFVLFCHSGEV